MSKILAPNQATKVPRKTVKELRPTRDNKYLDMFEKLKAQCLTQDAWNTNLLKKVIDNGLGNGTIRRTASSWARPSLFPSKKCLLYFCVYILILLVSPTGLLTITQK